MVDYLVIGHVTLDWVSGGPPPCYTLGGTVTFAGLMAQALGCRVGVATAAAATVDLATLWPGIAVWRAPSAATTTFENRYTPAGRQQIIGPIAAPLTPAAWSQPLPASRVVHLAPVAQEIDRDLFGGWPAGVVLGLTPQGLLRRWDAAGCVYTAEWAEALSLLPQTSAVIFSLEDLPDLALLSRWREVAPLLVMTQGAAGCTLFYQGATRQLPAPMVVERNPTGAGDVFAAVFLWCLGLRESANGAASSPGLTLEELAQAALLANRAAAWSVTADSLRDKIALARQAIGDERGL